MDRDRRGNHKAQATVIPANERVRGFTLIELVIAVAILSISVLGLLFLRVEAIERVGKAHRGRYLQRVAQQKLDEVMFGIELNMDGQLETDPSITWRVEAHELSSTSSTSTNTDIEDILPEDGMTVVEEPRRLVECTITVTYTVDGTDAEPQEYTLSSWFFPPDGSSLIDQIGSTEPRY